MTNDFDKEIDSLLRQTARVGGSESVLNGKNSLTMHIDADEISLFAENALPGKTRLRVMDHLADCDRCRKVLSGLILLNSAAESENIHAKEVGSTEVSLPWYKKLFMFPQIAYTMGALALVFSGVIALIVFQSARQSENASVAKMDNVEERQQGGKGMSSDGDAPTKEVYSMSNSTSTTTNTSTANTSSNSTSSANIASATPTVKSASTLSANSNAAVAMNERPVSADKDAPAPPAPATAAPMQNKPVDSVKTEAAKKEDIADDGPTEKRRDNEVRGGSSNDQNVTNKQQSELSMVQNQAGANITPDSRNARSAPQRSVDSVKSVATEEEADAKTKEAKGKTAPTATTARKVSTTRTAGGKTFNFREGAWYDSAYSNQKTTNVRRGTEDYKKLDGGLRSISENIGGVVVIVWKSKAYRIQ